MTKNKKFMLMLISIGLVLSGITAPVTIYAAGENEPADTAANSATAKPNHGANTALPTNTSGWYKVKKKAYIYNNKGKRLKKKDAVKKGTIFIAMGFTATGGKNYIQYKKGQYLRQNDLTDKFAVISYKVKKKARVYNSKGKAKKLYVKKGATVYVTATKRVKGKELVKIISNKNYYIKYSALKAKSGKPLN